MELSAAEQLAQQQERELVRRALTKQAAKQPVSAKELAALRRWEAAEDQKRGMRFVRRLSKKTYSDWSGRPTKILHDQARLYGVPLLGAEIDLVAVVAWLHDWLATHKHELGAIAKGESDEAAGSLKGRLMAEQIAMLEKRNTMLEQDLAKRHESLLPRSDVRELLARCATILRGAGDRLYKRCGDEAGTILAEAIDDFEREVGQLDGT